MPKFHSFNRTQLAVVIGQALSFLLIITFIFANQRFDLMATFGGSESDISMRAAYVAACLVGIVGAVSIWTTLHYLTKSNELRDMVVLCAWSQQVKVDGDWVSFREFLSEKLGYAVSHGMCEETLAKMRAEVEGELKGKERDRPVAKETLPAGEGVARVGGQIGC